MTNIIKLEARGCNFWKDDKINDFSDVGNYRVGVYNYDIKGKDGNNYILSFGRCDHYNYRTTHKRTGKPLKHAIREIIIENGLHIDTQYENERGCWRNCKLESDIYNMHLPYTKAGILKAINYISAIPYDDIEIIL